MGYKVVYPRPDLSYCANFLNMMFDNPVRPYIIDKDLVRALDIFWIFATPITNRIVQLRR